MIRRLQEWLGERAIIDVPEFAAWIIGIRHSHFNWRNIDGPNIVCPKVHRSTGEWWACISTETSAWQQAMITKMFPDDLCKRADAMQRMESAKFEADAMLARLR